MILDGESYLYSERARRWVRTEKSLNSSASTHNRTVEKSYLTERESKAIYIIQRGGEYIDIAYHFDIKENSARALVSKVRGKRTRAENTIRVLGKDYGRVEHVGRGVVRRTSLDDDAEWRKVVENTIVQTTLVETILSETFLSANQAVVLVMLQHNYEPDEIAEVLGIDEDLRIAPGTVVKKRYIPKLRNNRRRSVNTLKFLEGDTDYVDFSESYAIGD